MCGRLNLAVANGHLHVPTYHFLKAQENVVKAWRRGKRETVMHGFLSRIESSLMGQGAHFATKEISCLCE